MAGHRVAHATLKGPSVVKELIIGMALGLAAGGLWKMHHWNEQRKTRAFYDLLERDRPETKWIICGAAIYIAALSHDIADMGEETITYILNEFANTEAASLTVEELKKSDSILLEKPFTPRPNSDKEVVNCKHKDSKSFGYGLCKDCHEKFIEVSAAVCLSEESEASDESDNLSGLDGDPVESKNAPPASTAFEACTRMLESKGLVNYDLLKELLDPSRIKKKEDEEDPAEDEEQDKNVS